LIAGNSLNEQLRGNLETRRELLRHPLADAAFAGEDLGNVSLGRAVLEVLLPQAPLFHEEAQHLNG
jgi:hypothetical protein